MRRARRALSFLLMVAMLLPSLGRATPAAADTLPEWTGYLEIIQSSTAAESFNYSSGDPGVEHHAGAKREVVSSHLTMNLRRDGTTEYSYYRQATAAEQSTISYSYPFPTCSRIYNSHYYETTDGRGRIAKPGFFIGENRFGDHLIAMSPEGAAAPTLGHSARGWRRQCGEIVEQDQGEEYQSSAVGYPYPILPPDALLVDTRGDEIQGTWHDPASGTQTTGEGANTTTTTFKRTINYHLVRKGGTAKIVVYTEPQKEAYKQQADKAHETAWEAYVLAAAVGVVDPPAGVALTLLGLAMDKLAAELDKKVDDPPDPNYTAIPQPTIEPLPRGVFEQPDALTQAELAALLAFLPNVEEQIALERAIFAGMERAAGAAAAGDTAWQTRQVQAMQDRAARLAELQAAEPALRAAVAAAFQGDTRIVGVAATPAMFEAFYLSLSTDGLPESLAQALAALGQDEAQQQAYLQRLLDEPALGVMQLGGNLATDLATPESLAAIEGARTANTDFAAGSFTLDLTGNAAGTVTATPSAPTYTAGTVVTLVATPPGDKVLYCWWVDGFPVNAGRIFTLAVNAVHDIRAEFDGFCPDIPPMILTYSSQGPGHISSYPEHLRGTRALIEAVPDPGADFVGWIVDGQPMAGGRILELLMEEDRTVIAIFAYQQGGTVAVTIPAVAGGTAIADPPGPIPPGQVVTLAATPGAGQVFIGWQLASSGPSLSAVAPVVSWANPLTVTVAADLVATPVFAPAASFPDVGTGRGDHAAIVGLATRGYIRGYQDGRYGPDDTVSRAQMAALIARATPAGPGAAPTNGTLASGCVAGSWDCEDWGNDFADRGGLVASLWRNVGTLQHYGVAGGYDGIHFGPNDDVTYAQTIAFITRAMVAKGYWQWQPNGPTPPVGVPSGHNRDVRTFLFYAGATPDLPTGEGWNDGATRGWFATALWQALGSYWATDGVMPDGQPAGGYQP